LRLGVMLLISLMLVLLFYDGMPVLLFIIEQELLLFLIDVWLPLEGLDLVTCTLFVPVLLVFPPAIYEFDFKQFKDTLLLAGDLTLVTREFPMLLFFVDCITDIVVLLVLLMKFKLGRLFIDILYLNSTFLLMGCLIGGDYNTGD